MRRFALVVAGLLTAALGGWSVFAAGNWPQWRGLARDGVTVDVALRTTWPTVLRPAWKVDVGVGHSSPVVADGRVYLFAREREQETLQAFELSTGKRLWRQAYPAPYTVNSAALAHGPGPKATPVVAGGRVFTFGISGILSAFDAASGRVVWRKEFGKEFPSTAPIYGAAQSPVVDRGRVIVHVGGSGGGRSRPSTPRRGRWCGRGRVTGPGTGRPWWPRSRGPGR